MRDVVGQLLEAGAWGGELWDSLGRGWGGGKLMDCGDGCNLSGPGSRAALGMGFDE